MRRLLHFFSPQSSPRQHFRQMHRLIRPHGVEPQLQHCGARQQPHGQSQHPRQRCVIDGPQPRNLKQRDRAETQQQRAEQTGQQRTGGNAPKNANRFRPSHHLATDRPRCQSRTDGHRHGDRHLAQQSQLLSPLPREKNQPIDRAPTDQAQWSHASDDQSQRHVSRRQPRHDAPAPS